MTTKYDKNSAFTIALSIAASIIIIAGIMAARSIVVPVLLALFLSIKWAAPILFLEKRKRTVFNFFIKPQPRILVEGVGQPTFQMYAALNMQF